MGNHLGHRARPLLWWNGINAAVIHPIASPSAQSHPSLLVLVHSQRQLYISWLRISATTLNDVIPKNGGPWYKQSHLVRLNFCIFSLFMFCKNVYPRL